MRPQPGTPEHKLAAARAHKRLRRIELFKRIGHAIGYGIASAAFTFACMAIIIVMIYAFGDNALTFALASSIVLAVINAIEHFIGSGK